MERFVFVAAIVVASFFAIGAMFGGFHGGGWHFDIDDAHGSPAPLVAVAPGQMAAQTFAGGAVRVRHAAARIVVIAEDRQDFSIEIDNPGQAPMPLVSIDDGDVLIDGQLRGRIDECTETGADLDGYGAVTHERMPLVTIRAPRRLEISLAGANFVEIGATEALEINHAGCGVTTAGDVTEMADIDLAGSGRVTIGAARRLDTDLAGSGSLTTGAIAEAVEIDMAGSGSIEIGELSGTFERDGAGSGNVVVRGGAVTTADINQAGSGDVEIIASVQTLDVAIMGSGDVAVTGAVSALEARIMGSGNVTVNGAVGSIDANIMGSGEVRAQSMTGQLSQRVRGSGQVVIGD